MRQRCYNRVGGLPRAVAAASVVGANPKYSGIEFLLLDQAKSRSPRIAISIFVVSAMALATLLAVFVIATHRQTDPHAEVFRISGSSMAPTLLGESVALRCSDCKVDWLADASDATGGICWHCGQPMESPMESSGVPLIPGEIVEVFPRKGPPSRGQLITFNQQGRLVVKRVFGIPGDTIDIDGLRLIVNGKRIDDIQSEQTPTPIPVDHDLYRKVSRWQSTDAAIRREPSRAWTLAATSPSSQLIYHHQSVHDQNRPSPVWDDYPTNVGLSRQLESVNRLELSGNVIRATDDAEIEVTFWSERGSVSTVLPRETRDSFNVDQSSLGQPNNLAVAPESPLVSAETPIAIRMHRGSATIEQLSIYRHIEYRLRRLDDRAIYPIQLAEDQFFVLGDNVPISIDSRNHGPIKLADIIGVVQARSNSTPGRRANPKSTRTIE